MEENGNKVSVRSDWEGIGEGVMLPRGTWCRTREPDARVNGCRL
jgi:hypothetical protein